MACTTRLCPLSCATLLLLALVPAGGARSAPATEGPPQASPSGPALLPPSLQEDAPARYPPALAASGEGGEVVLELVVDAEGRVESAQLAQPAHPLLAAAALHAAPALRFAPARLQGQAVPVRVHFTYRFTPPPPAPTPLQVRPATLVGRVATRGNRRPLPGAAVRVEGQEGLVAETDETGAFRLALPPGTHRLTLSAPGHRPLTVRETLEEGETLRVRYRLEPTRLHPYETVVRAEALRAEEGRLRLEGAEAREVPGTLGDPFRAVMLLPGVSGVLSGVGYPVVRGSQPAATGYFLDGVRIPVLYHLLLGPAVVHPHFLEGVDFYSGTAPARFGRLMGGAVEGRLARPRSEGLAATATADLLNAGLYAELPLPDSGTALSLAGRVSYTGVLATKVASRLMGESGEAVLDFFDYQGRVEQRLGSGRLRLLAFGASDTGGVREREYDASTSLQSLLFHRVDARWRGPLGAGTAEAGITWGLDTLGTESSSGPMLGASLAVDQTTWAGRARWERPLAEGVRLEVGGDVERRGAGLRSLMRFPSLSARGVETLRSEEPLASALLAGLYGQLEVQRGRWTVSPGLRGDSYHLYGADTHWALEPRLSVRHRLSEAVSLKGGAGLFHQAPTLLIQLPVVDMAGLAFGLQRSWQLDVGAEWKVARGLEVGVDVYLNRLARTVEFDPFTEPPRVASLPDDNGDGEGDVPAGGRVPAYVENPARDGWAYGLELLVRHPLGEDWFGWLSYTLQRSVRRATFATYDAEGLLSGQREAVVPFAYDQTHVANLVLSRRLPRNWTVGGVLHYHSGRPEFGTGALSRQTHALTPDAWGGTWRTVSRDEAQRLPGFFRLDVRVAKAWTFDDFSLEASLDFLNATFSKEVTGISYRYQGGGVALPGSPLPQGLRSLFGAPHTEDIGIPLALPMLRLEGRY